MDQDWKMIAYERRETLATWGKYESLRDAPGPSRVIIKLAAVEDYSDAECGPAPDHQSPQRHACFLQLPIDMVLLITDQLELNFLYTLSRCCWAVCRLLSPEVDTRFRRMFAAWANTPLICAGDYMHSNPPGITIQDFTLDPWHQGGIPSQGYVGLTVYDLMRQQLLFNVVR